MHYPVFLNLAGRACLVVGGGEVALRRARDLLACGATVTVVAESPGAALERLASRGRVRLERRPLHDDDAAAAVVVLSATDDRDVNRRLMAIGQRHGKLVNVYDRPEESSFIYPAVTHRGSLCIAISTGGKSPTMARRIKDDIEARYGPEYAPLLDLLGAMRERIKRRIEDPAARREALDRVFTPELLRLLKQGKRKEARALSARRAGIAR
ncbi:MAG: bifunctional precorrin-2 dehydrogenase/sirohydrochlorin ferrochelatase [Acidobacteriota bacterium]